MRAFVVGAFTTEFGRLPGRTHKDLAREAALGALTDAGVDAAAVGRLAFGSCALHAWGQANLGGQVCGADLVEAGALGAGTPVVNVEAGCATGTVAFQTALADVLSGQVQLSLALGVDKTFFPEDPVKTFGIFNPALDQLDPELWQAHYRREAEAHGLEFAPRPDRLVLLDVCALIAQRHMQRHGTTVEQLAAVAAKNHTHGVDNPKAQYRKARSAADVLGDRPVIAPFTRSMCAPISDGAAAVLVVSEAGLQTLPEATQRRAVEVLASARGGGAYRPLDAPHAVAALARRAYAQAGLEPDAVDLAEVHDATAFAEVALVEALGFCPPGEGGAYSASGATQRGGARPVNLSGGLLAKGHPLAASGLAMLGEVTAQLRGEAGPRQAAGARVGLVHNGGGLLGFDEATSTVTLLARR
ncbi:MAG: thiolase family protein [Planctomycetes bacterium]|nr:thiolase family protein [Planctomycetota bacterium]